VSNDPLSNSEVVESAYAPPLVVFAADGAWSARRAGRRATANGHIDFHNSRAREWRPAQLAAGIEPLRRPYDLRHTYAFALRELSRFMGASLAMIDRH
jgi:integrase